MQTAHNAWHELNTWQPGEAIDFYTRTLGWEFESQPLPDGTQYWIALSENTPVGGICQLSGPAYRDIAPHWMTYMKVNDIETALEEAFHAGGKVLRGPIDVEAIGRLAVIEDHNRALIGLIEPVQKSPLYMI